MTSFLHKKNRHIKKEGLQQQLHWYVVLAVVVVGLLLILIKGVHSFVEINYDQGGVVEKISDVTVVFDLEKLEESNTYFDLQNKKHVELLITPPEVTDPS